MADLATLRTAKQAMDEGLIGDAEFQMIKQAFTKAQMIKAGLDAGFITEEAFVQARNSFLQSLDFQVQEPVPVPAAPASYAAAAPRGVASTGAAAGYAQGNGAVAQLRQQQPSRSASPGPAAQSAGGPPAPPPPPPQLNKPAPQLAMPVRAPVATNGLEGNISGTLPGTVPVPENLAPIGRKGTAEGKKSMAGIGLDDSCINVFNHIKTKSTFKWVTFRINDQGTMVVVDLLGAPDCSYEDFLALLPESQCRYAVFDYAYTNQETSFTTQKLVFIHWSPEGSSTKSKMMYSSTKDFIKGFLDGVGAEMQGDCVEDLAEGDLQSRIAGNMTRK